MSELKGRAYLKSKLNKKKTWARTRYDYYELKNLKADPSPVIPGDLVSKFGSKLGWCAKAVDSLANRLIFDGFENDNFDLWEIFQMNNPDIFFDSAIRSALISACCFVYISADEDGYPRLQVIDGKNATGRIDPITNLLIEGYAILETNDNGTVLTDAYFTSDRTEIYYKGVHTRYEMEDVVIVDGRARGIIAKNLVTGKLERFSANAVVIATGGYGNTYFLSTNAMGCNCTAAVQCYRKGAYFANPSYVQIHPTCIPVHGDKQSKLTLMSESLRNDGRIWVPKKIEDAKALQAGTKQGWEIPEEDRDYYLERRYPAFGNLVPRDVASRAAKERCDKGFGVNNTGLAVFLDFSESINRLGLDVIMQRYGNLFEMYEEITDVFPGDVANEINGVKYYKPMMIYPAIHYTMGGIWVDYELQTTIPGLFAIGECNFSDHGANRLGASALMQGLADGYFVLPYTIQNYLADQAVWPKVSTDLPEFEEAEKKVDAEQDRLLNIKGKRSVDSIHKELGHIMWEYVGMGRTAEGLKEGLKKMHELEKEFDTNLFVPGTKEGLNVELDKAIHLRDFFTMGQLVAFDALSRNESCGGHFREEYQTEEGEAKRDDENYFYVGCWEYKGKGNEPELIKEPLEYEAIKVQTRNYKN